MWKVRERVLSGGWPAVVALSEQPLARGLGAGEGRTGGLADVWSGRLLRLAVRACGFECDSLLILGMFGLEGRALSGDRLSPGCLPSFFSGLMDAVCRLGKAFSSAMSMVSPSFFSVDITLRLRPMARTAV